MERSLYWLLDLLKDLISKRGKNKKDVQYLCSCLILGLGRYASGCADVVGDDGLCYGQSDENGYLRAQVSEPTLDFGSPDSEWKLLPSMVMYELVHFPRDIEMAKAMISAASENSHPPDFEEAFEERQYQYAKLGLKSCSLASKLRTLAKLPEMEAEERDIVKYFEEQKASIDAKREHRVARILSFVPSIVPTHVESHNSSLNPEPQQRNVASRHGL